MGLTKSKGNMYPWVTHTHTHLGGKCPHNCCYCYVQEAERRFKTGRYAGPLRLIEDELKVIYRDGRTIFIEHCNDLFAESVNGEWIERILRHCNQWPDNLYVFQTKNPAGYFPWLTRMPPRHLLGCTIETTHPTIAAAVSDAPKPTDRFMAMTDLNRRGQRTFITIEPILNCDMRTVVDWCRIANPEFVNIGADSKGTDLDEPTAEQVRQLIDLLEHYGVEIREKHNLDRILKGDGS